MTLESEIRTIINDTICGKYIGKLKVSKEVCDDGEDPLWALFLYLDTEYSPLVMAYQGTEEQFKEFIRKEIKSRKLQGVSFWKAEQAYNDEEYE